MTAKRRPQALTPQHTLTRHDVAARLGVSVSTVRRMELVQLYPVADEHGVWRFDPADLEGLEVRPRPRRALATPPSHEGRLAARTFVLFARGASLREIVVTTRQAPERVRALYHEWMTSLDEGEWARARE